MRNLRENFPQAAADRTESAFDATGRQRQVTTHGTQRATQQGTSGTATSAHTDAESDAAWKSHFSLGQNVRFTRTPEVELMRRRGETLPEPGENTPAPIRVSYAPETAIPTPVKAVDTRIAEPAPPAPIAQPMAVAALQQAVTQHMTAPLAPVATPPFAPVTEPGTAPVTGSVAALDSLSDFAFWESFDSSSFSSKPLASAIQPVRITPPSDSIVAQFRVMEWHQPQAEPTVPEAMAAPQPVIAPVVNIEPVVSTIAAPVAPVITPIVEDIVVAAVVETNLPVTEPAPTATLAPVPAARVAPRIAPYQPSPLPQTSVDYVSGEYEFPPHSLLQEPPAPDGTVITQEMLERSAGLLESVLEDFGVRGEIIHVRPGPVVTLYEFEPAPGVKSSRVIGLADDIARSMSALSARVAVVPGRNVIGIELPNANRETVYFREMIEAKAFQNSNFHLPLCLGKAIGGEPIIAELAKMPHLLVAGTTGSGKSVAINTMILSLLYRLKPEECRLIMVDPKMLELSIYDGIPHLLTPVVTDPKKAVVALKWAVREMEDRYRKMARLGVRNIEGFNARAASAKGKGETVMCTVQSGFDRETGEAIYVEEELDLTMMPYIVVIVDEMADLMMVAGKDIEGAIQRLAQMARAAGIHLIMATQRPSVDVITGTIKANFPTRISFQVTSKIDSRTILGEMGAEQLLGQGDMLHMAGGGRIVRVHGPFVSDEEVEKVVNHLKAQGRPDYLATVTAEDDDESPIEDDTGAVFDQTASGSEEGDELYEQAVKVVQRDKKCSTSYIQRRLGIGYNRAASLVERMEKSGLVGAANHVGKREILSANRDHD